MTRSSTLKPTRGTSFRILVLGGARARTNDNTPGEQREINQLPYNGG